MALVQRDRIKDEKISRYPKQLGCPRGTAVEHLMEQYQLAHETAAVKVDDLCGRS